MEHDFKKKLNSYDALCTALSISTFFFGSSIKLHTSETTNQIL